MKEYDYTWTTTTGKKIHIDDMDEAHAKNCLKLILRRIQDNEEKILAKKNLHILPYKQAESRIADRIWEDGKQEEEDEQGSWSEHCRDESYKYNHETGLLDIT